MLKYVLVYILLALTTGARLEFDSDDCKVYLEKFGFAETGGSKYAFSGNVFFIGATADVEVKLKYSDFDYFNDPKFYGLVIQDGKTPETTCLDMKLFKYAASDFSGRVEVTDLTITPSENQTEQQRFYSFTIKRDELAARLIETKNNENFIYKGYYAIAYYAAQTDLLQYTFYFGFSVIINRLTGAAVDSSFQLFNCVNDTQNQQSETCQVSLMSIQWCTDFTCTSFSTPDLHFNDQFVLLLKIRLNGLTGYLLTENEVRLTGNGLDKKATIVQLDNKTTGQAKLLLNADIVWRAVTIKVTSTLKKNPSSINRLMEQTIFDTITGQTAEITCIKAEDFDMCSTCEQECDANGFASDGCDSCSSAQIFYIILFGALVLVF